MSSISIAEYKKLFPQPRETSTKRCSQSKGKRAISEGEAPLIQHFKAHNIIFKHEFQFNPKRKWRADFHILNTKILIEVEGGWSNGRHSRGKGYIADMEKLGYQVYRYSTEQVKSGKAIEKIRRLIG